MVFIKNVIFVTFNERYVNILPRKVTLCNLLALVFLVDILFLVLKVTICDDIWCNCYQTNVSCNLQRIVIKIA